jgi:hypothetical protein
MFWLLVAPADLVEQFAHVIVMISHSQSTFDQIGNSFGGPQLCSVPVGHGSLDQETNKLVLLFRAQSRGRPDAGLAFSASCPPDCKALRQRITLLAWHPIRRAIS